MPTRNPETHLSYALCCRRNMQVDTERCVEGRHSLVGTKTVELSDGKVFEVAPAGTMAVYVTRVR